VSNEHYCKVELPPECAKKREDFLLCRGVQRGRWFVGDDEPRAAGNRLSQQNALALAAAQLVRIRVGDSFDLSGENGCEDLQRLFAPRLPVQRFVRRNDIADLFADMNGRVKGHGWLLNDERDLPAADSFKLSRAGAHEVLSLEADSTFQDSPVGWKQPQKRSCQRALPRAGLSKHSHRFPCLKVKADTSHAGTILTGLRTVCDMQILDFKKGAHAMTRANLVSFLPVFIREMGRATCTRMLALERQS
jgi:hypothetical protein